MQYRGSINSSSTTKNRLEAMLINDYLLRIPSNYPINNTPQQPIQMEIETDVSQVQDNNREVTSQETQFDNQQTPQTYLQTTESDNEIEKSREEEEQTDQQTPMGIDSLIDNSDLGQEEEESYPSSIYKVKA